MSLFCVWSLTFYRLCGWETHLAVVSHTFLCLHVSGGKDGIWGKPTLECVPWNFLQGLGCSLLGMTCKFRVLQRFRSSFPSTQTHQLSFYILSQAAIPSAPCLALWPWITAPVLGQECSFLRLLELEDHQPAHYGQPDGVSLSPRLISAPPGLRSVPALSGRSRDIVRRCRRGHQPHRIHLRQFWLSPVRKEPEIPFLLCVTPQHRGRLLHTRRVQGLSLISTCTERCSVCVSVCACTCPKTWWLLCQVRDVNVKAFHKA